MALIAQPQISEYENVEKRRHPAIYGEAPSSPQFGLLRLDRIFLDQLREVSATSRYFELEQLYSAMRDQLSALRSVNPGWDGYGAAVPNQLAIENSRITLEELRRIKARPAGVLPSADGGVGIYFTRGERYAHIELENSGEVWGLMYGNVGSPQTWELPANDADSILEAWNRISAYLQS